MGDLGSIPRLGRSLGEGKGYPLQHSGLENSMDRGAWQATVHGVAKSQILLSDFHTSHTWTLIQNNGFKCIRQNTKDYKETRYVNIIIKMCDIVICVLLY